ncbi:hypothetical protein L5F43_11285 [Aliarcobacter butzleri]|uniref:MAE_28990/MAE_18760 family HEPN-like nuclease n=1 Tax=Aliarcobacter butzleri TaxID=28197 RepID=UPI0039BEAB4D|nr:hypothetical protein [Aliarcobacter butzleri]
MTIKNKRNGLAHGNHTFYDVGKDFTVGDIENFKKETFLYLQDVITNIEKFINERFIKQPLEYNKIKVI